MKLLLDTHIFLWYISADARLPASYVATIQDPTNQVFLSVAAIWEAVIKYALGKLPMPVPPGEFLPRERTAHGIISLPIDEPAIEELSKLPPIHRDPFDRIMVAQAMRHGLTLVSVDPVVRKYPASFLS